MNALKIKQVIMPPPKAGASNVLKQAPGPRKKGGRPKKDAADQLTKKITVNCTQEEFDQLSKAADDAYLPVSVLIRKCLKESGYIS